MSGLDFVQRIVAFLQGTGTEKDVVILRDLSKADDSLKADATIGSCEVCSG